MNGHVVNACDAQDEREAAGVAAPAPTVDLDVEKLRGLSRMIADRAVTQLEKEIEDKVAPFFTLFSSGGTAQRQFVIRTASGRIKVEPDPALPGGHLVKFYAGDIRDSMKAKAVDLARGDVVAEALREFLERADNLADDVQQLRDQVQS